MDHSSIFVFHWIPRHHSCLHLARQVSANERGALELERQRHLTCAQIGWNSKELHRFPKRPRCGNIQCRCAIGTLPIHQFFSDQKCIPPVATAATCLPCIGLESPFTNLQEPDPKSDSYTSRMKATTVNALVISKGQPPKVLSHLSKPPILPAFKRFSKITRQPQKRKDNNNFHLNIHVQTFELQALLQVPRGSVLRSKLQCSIQLYQDCLFQGLGQLRVVVIQPDGMSSSKMTCHTLRDGMSWGMRLSLPETKLGKARWLKFDCDHCASYKKAVKTQRRKKYRKCIKIYTIYK